MADFAFCHGWYINRDYNEVMCKKRGRCPYYDIDFYRKHGNHLQDFEELFPEEPCKWFRGSVVEEKEEVVDLFGMLRMEDKNGYE